MTDCPLDPPQCDDGYVDVTDFTGTTRQRCPCGLARQRAAGLRLAAQMESEARYYDDRRIDVGSTVRRIRTALELTTQETA